MSDKIVSVSGFAVNNTANTQCDYMLVGLTESGRVVISRGDRDWVDVSPLATSDAPQPQQQAGCKCISPALPICPAWHRYTAATECCAYCGHLPACHTKGAES